MLSFDEGAEVVSSLPAGGIARSKGIVRVRFPTYARPIAVSRLLYRYKQQPGEGIGEIYYAFSSKRQGWVSFVEKAYIALQEMRAKQQQLANPAVKMVSGYQLLEERLDELTIWRNLMLGPHGSPRVYNVRSGSGRQAMLAKLRNAATFPTTATTPPASPGSRSLNTKSGLWLDHVYAVLSVKTSRDQAGRTAATVALLGDGETGVEEIPIGNFLAEMDHFTQCEIREPSIPA
jgi:hypothetical protein